MRITYSLSNTQRKELLVRGAPLTIAIPLNDSVDPDPVAFARASLPDDNEQITDAEIGVIWIGGGIGAAGVAGLVGQIWPTWEEPVGAGIIPLSVEVAVVTLTPSRPRQKAKPVQWPGRAWIDGVDAVLAIKGNR